MPSPANKRELDHLIEKYISGTATPEESAFVEAYYEQFEQGEDPFIQMPVQDQDALKQKIFSAVNDATAPCIAKVVSIRKRFLRIAVAAAVLAVVSVVSYRYLSPKGDPSSTDLITNVTKATDLPAGVDGAVLTLADGRTIVIDTSRDGMLVNDERFAIKKTNGLIAVDASGNNSSAAFNTLSTPRGRQIQLELPDGSKVWLNAESELKFPADFTGTERIVEMKGEAYFEVAKDAKKPFIVRVDNSSVEVLGTHFNVMGYDNESALSTTLVEGSVRFRSASGNTMMLSPGQQSQLRKNGDLQLDKNADIAFATAWKNGQQLFRQADIPTIMRQLERWYDVTVVYKGDVPKRTFSGDIPRNANLSQLLTLFDAAKINYSIDYSTKTLTIMP
jgi:hypothetical protein